MKTKQLTGFLRSKDTLTWIVYGLCAFFTMLMQMAPRFFPVILEARPTPLILLVIGVALFEGPRIGGIIGAIAGLLWDLYTFRVFGLHAMLLMIIGVTVGLLVQLVLRTNFLSGMLLCVCGVLTHTLLEWLLCYVLFLHDESVTVLWNVYLPNAVYTIVLSPFVYGITLLLARLLRRRKRQ